MRKRPAQRNRLRLLDRFVSVQTGIQIQARSPAVPTLVIQLANGSRNPEPSADASEYAKAAWHYASSNTYLPTDRALQGGGYSANAQSIIVGPEGGQVLVEETLKMIDAMWRTTP